LGFGPFQLGGLAVGAVEEVPAKVLREQLGVQPPGKGGARERRRIR
jgi:23S rRNA pseudouridine2605 synthase